MLHRYRAIWLLAAVLECGAVAAQDGYVIRGDRIISEGEDAWRQWLFPVGTIDFDAQSVRPHFVARGINASLDAQRFPLEAADDEEKGGIHAAGSNASRRRKHPRWRPLDLLGTGSRRSAGSMVGGD